MYHCFICMRVYCTLFTTRWSFNEYKMKCWQSLKMGHSPYLFQYAAFGFKLISNKQVKTYGKGSCLCRSITLWDKYISTK